MRAIYAKPSWRLRKKVLLIVRSSGALLLSAVAAFLLNLSIGGCTHHCPSALQKEGWTYSASDAYDACQYKLAFNSREVSSFLTLVTPFGTLQNVRAEEPGDDAGWVMIDERTSGMAPFSHEAIGAVAISQGFYASNGTSRLRGTPGSWVYLANVRTPGWVSPERLFDPVFLAQHSWSPVQVEARDEPVSTSALPLPAAMPRPRRRTAVEPSYVAPCWREYKYQLTIEPEGRVSRAFLTQGTASACAEAIANALLLWKFEPVIIKGRATAITYEETVEVPPHYTRVPK